MTKRSSAKDDASMLEEILVGVVLRLLFPHGENIDTGKKEFYRNLLLSLIQPLSRAKKLRALRFINEFRTKILFDYKTLTFSISTPVPQRDGGMLITKPRV